MVSLSLFTAGDWAAFVVFEPAQHPVICDNCVSPSLLPVWSSFGVRGTTPRRFLYQVR